MHVDLSKTIFGTLFIDEQEISLVEALAESKLCPSKGRARQMIKNGAVHIGGSFLNKRGRKTTDTGEVLNEFPTVVWCGKHPRTIDMLP